MLDLAYASGYGQSGSGFAGGPRLAAVVDIVGQRTVGLGSGVPTATASDNTDVIFLLQTEVEARAMIHDRLALFLRGGIELAPVAQLYVYRTAAGERVVEAPWRVAPRALLGLALAL